MSSSNPAEDGAALSNSGHTEHTEKAEDAFSNASNAMSDAQRSFQAYEGSKSLKLVNRSGDFVDKTQSNASAIQGAISTVAPVYESDNMQAIRDGVNTLIDSLPGLLRALDTVAQLHPFIGVAVGAFKVVVELDLKRRDNDKKIASLFLQMKNMMGALLQLRSIKDNDIVGPDGETIEARMQGLVKQTADDITSCGNACDTYAKKRMIVKVIKGSFWDTTLKGYIDLFAKRQKEFTFALAIHTGAAVDEANRKLDELDSKMNIVLQYFKEASSSPEQDQLAALIQAKGGPAVVMSNLEVLRELLTIKPGSAKRSDGQAVEQHSEDLNRIREELFESPEVAIQKNFDIFERKFRMQQREFAEEMRRVIHHEGDRVVEAVTSGPHDRIIDPDIHEIWKGMRWSGHVKTRHFVLALLDYFREQFELKKRARGENFSSRIRDEDEWTMEWVNVKRLYAIAEAFDDDASGFVTIAEVNQFTTSRPKEWSLLHWLAYWAIGWQMTGTLFIEEILRLFGKMFSLERLILPANRRAVANYLEHVYPDICILTMSFNCTNEPDSLKKRFQSYVLAEGSRLTEGLVTIRYNIDAADTLRLVMGPGRVEKSLFSLIYLLLKRHFEVMRLCRKKVISKDELGDAAKTIKLVMDAVTQRHDDLEVLFKQQGFDPAQQFKIFACELFDYWHDRSQFDTLENLRKYEFTEYEYVEDAEEPIANPDVLLNYPLPNHDLYRVIEYSPTDNDNQADAAIRPILGRWHGFLYLGEAPIDPMLSFCLHASVDRSTFEASEIAAHGARFVVTGGYTRTTDGSIEYNFTITFSMQAPKIYCVGTVDENTGRLVGRHGIQNTPEKIFKLLFFQDIPPELIVARPPPSEFEANRIGALWKYALTAALNDVRKKMFSWSYLKERRTIRLEYLDILDRSDGFITFEEANRWRYLQNFVTCEDMRTFYALHANKRPRFLEARFLCDVCEEPLREARSVCLKCNGRETVDLCDKSACKEATVSREDLSSPHLPSHDIVKVRRGLHQFREVGKLLRTSDAALERARKLLTSAISTTVTSAPEGQQADQAEEPSHSRAPSAASNTPIAKIRGTLGEFPAPMCMSCSSIVSYPCWYCVDCPVDSNAFICIECDQKRGGFVLREHIPEHSLVFCKEKAVEETDPDKSMEKRLSALEGKLVAMEQKFVSFAEQMERIEQILQSLAVTRPT
ncbi:hypothetical protein FKP32DRAFT_1587743 [Trametes sanguinea]|nr:hypothetical protein FKP32DRAFT_1587743 [Trametes sanguinea]